MSVKVGSVPTVVLSPEIDLSLKDPLGVKRNLAETEELIKGLPDPEIAKKIHDLVIQLGPFFEGNIENFKNIKKQIAVYRTEFATMQPEAKKAKYEELCLEIKKQKRCFQSDDASEDNATDPIGSMNAFLSKSVKHHKMPMNDSIHKLFEECIADLNTHANDLFVFIKRKIFLIKRDSNTPPTSERVAKTKDSVRALETCILNITDRHEPTDLDSTTYSAIFSTFLQKEEDKIIAALDEARKNGVNLSHYTFSRLFWHSSPHIDHFLSAGFSVGFVQISKAKDLADTTFARLADFAFLPGDENRKLLSSTISLESFTVYEPERVTSTSRYTSSMMQDYSTKGTIKLRVLIGSGMKPPCPTETITVFARDLLYFGSPVAKFRHTICNINGLADFSAYDKAKAIREYVLSTYALAQSQALTAAIVASNTPLITDLIALCTTYFPNNVEGLYPEDCLELYDWCMAEEAANKAITSYPTRVFA